MLLCFVADFCLLYPNNFPISIGTVRKILLFLVVRHAEESQYFQRFFFFFFLFARACMRVYS